MATIAPPSITALPSPPDPANRATFNTLAYPWSAALPTFSTEVSAVAVNVKANADDAATSSTTATTKAEEAVAAASAATATANASAWVNGGTYALNANAISGVDFQTYRKKTASSVTVTDPSADGANWVQVGGSTIGTGGTTSTASITLTASSAAAMTVTPATPGLYVTLPDATTCTKADNLYAVYNAGDYDYGVKDSAGTQLGWIRARTGAMIGLADNSTAAGVWAYYGLEKTGITASYVNSTIANTSDAAPESTRRIVVDADRVAFLFGGTSCYVIVYNQPTQTWGAATLVRASIANATYTGVLAAANLLMICSCDATTGMETVTVSLSDVTPTVNSGSKASTTLAGNISGGGLGFGQIIPVSTSWVVTYSRSTTTTAIRAITVSGTTPTVGAETALSTGVAGLANMYASGNIVRTVCASTSTALRCAPYTVSASTLSAGTGANVTFVSAYEFRSFVNGNGNIVVNYNNANHSATIFKLTTTTEVASTVILSSTDPQTINSRTDYAVVSASKTAYISHANSTNWYANILTDTAGTASVGTQITYATVGNMTGLANFGVSGNNVRFGYSATTQHGQFTLDCSGASPVLSSVVAAIYTSSSTSLPTPLASDRYGELGGNQLTVGASSMVLGGNVTASDYMFAANSLKRIGSLLTTGTPGNSTLIKPRSSNSDLWLFRPVGTTSIGYSFQRIEAAA